MKLQAHMSKSNEAAGLSASTGSATRPNITKLAAGGLSLLAELFLCGASGPAHNSPAALAPPTADCTIWSDGRLACSRPLRPDGRSFGPTECVRSQHQTLPAEARTICMGERSRGATSHVDRQADVSHSKYCRSWSIDAKLCIRSDQGSVQCRNMPATKIARPAHCRAWTEFNPFDGRSALALNHPWCQRWSSSYIQCDRNAAGTINCKWNDKPDPRAYTGQSLFACAKWNVPNWCRTWTDGFNEWDRSGCLTCKSDLNVSQEPRFVRCLTTER